MLAFIIAAVIVISIGYTAYTKVKEFNKTNKFTLDNDSVMPE